MSYTPTEWEPTDVVTATRMNALETAVGEMNMSYTPNTWSDGDILSAEKMNALEQAVASGGGGSSDFSTAEVTITNSSSENYFTLNIPFEEIGHSDIRVDVDPNSTEMKTAILYNGSAYAYDAYGGFSITVSGNASYSDGVVTVTGDCTITASDEEPW